VVSDHTSTEHVKRRAGSVVALWRYPVKSMAGERLEVVAVDADGIVGDRRFAVRDIETGKIASAKRPARWGLLLRCRAGVSADGAVRVTLPDGHVHTAGDSALDRALSQLLGRRVHLEHVDEHDGSRPNEYEADYPELEHISLRGRVTFPTSMMSDAASFVDLSAVHVLTLQTIAAVAEASGSGSVEAARFRANVLIDAKREPGFVEDEWIGHSVKIGDELTLERITPAARCKMTSVEQPGLPADDRILRAIAREHRVTFPIVGTLPCAGIFAEVPAPGVVRLSDEITVMQSSACDPEQYKTKTRRRQAVRSFRESADGDESWRLPAPEKPVTGQPELPAMTAPIKETS
jgi:uncharacterized protein